MITLGCDCLVFRTANGESVPYSAEMLSFDVMGESASLFEPEFVRQAAHAVFHYFKRDQGRDTISVGEFTEALEKVLRGFALSATSVPGPEREALTDLDLWLLARNSGPGCELFFFPRLRQELKTQLVRAPKVLRFCGLRSCVKELTGARRWTGRCRNLEEQIVEYLRECLGAESGQSHLTLLVE